MTETDPPDAAGRQSSPPLERARVRDAMSWSVITCAPTASLRDVAGIMATNRVHCVVVTTDESDRDGTLAERAWGLVTDLGVAAAVTAGSERSAADVAQPDVPIAEPHWPLLQAARVMAESGTAHLVVVDEQRHPIGVLSTLDVARILAGADR